MKEGVRISILFLMLILAGLLQGQDIHFAHFTGTGPLLSPAEAGAGTGSYRISTGHRSQWASVTTPFLSNHFSFDTHIRAGKRGARIGLGVSLQQDQAGDAGFGTTGGMLSLSLSLPVAKRQRILLGTGAGMMQRKFDRNALFLDEQFNGLTYDPEINPMDLAGSGPVTYLDLSAGAAWTLVRKSFEYRHLGIAVHHPNRPEISFLSNSPVALDIRWTAYFSGAWELSRSWAIRPESRLMKQGAYYEYILGAWGTRIMEDALPEQVAIEAGLFTRAGDAAILAIGGNMHAWRAAMSYEVNYSGLRKATAWRGGYELNLVYLVGRVAPELRRNPGCFIL